MEHVTKEQTIEELEFLNHEKYHEKWEEKRSLKRNYCVLVYELYDEVQLLTPEEFGRLVIGQLYYSVTGEVPTLPGNERYLFGRVKATEDQFQRYFMEEGRRRYEKAKKASDAAKRKRLAEYADHMDSVETLRTDLDP